MSMLPREPILAAPVREFAPPPGWWIEAKWDGFRALLARPAHGPVVIRSRQGKDLSRFFPDILAAAADLPSVAFDGEIVIWRDGRLAFELLLERLNRAPAAAARLARQTPAHYVAFDCLHTNAPLTHCPYLQRRRVLETLFTEHQLGPPWTLCPATDDPDIARQWLTWTTAGIEGLIFKNPAERYRPGVRAWRKYRVRHSTEALIGAVSGTLAQPSSLLLGRYDTAGRLRYVGRSTALDARRAREVATALTPAAPSHPWRGRTFSAGWGTNQPLHVHLTMPHVVAEVSADISRDPAGRWRHPVTFHRLRPDLSPADLPTWEAPPQAD